jgi:predicted nucleic acid-binding protein
MQELLQGSADQLRYRKLRGVFTLVPMLDGDVPLERYEEAAAIYLQCRDRGLTIRSSVDCLIAATAIAHRATLLHCDRDFDRIAGVTTLDAQRL